MSSRERLIREELLAAREHARDALGQLDAETEYLRSELEEHLARTEVLLEKMNQDTALTRDRNFLLAPDPAPWQGLGEWAEGDCDG